MGKERDMQNMMIWDEPKGASSPRGWLKATCALWRTEDRRTYNGNNMPVWDETVPGNWREQSTLGCYLEYSSACGPNGESILCVCYAAGNSTQWVRTIEEARAWVESAASAVRPELTIQRELFAA